MNILRIKKPVQKSVRDVVYDTRALKKAARESIQDQKAVTKEAAKLRTHVAQ